MFTDDPFCPDNGVLGNYPPIRRDNRAKVRQAPVAKGLEAYCGFQLELWLRVDLIWRALADDFRTFPIGQFMTDVPTWAELSIG